ncbi:MAG: WD40 repeat domain-containing protein [Cyanobacteria bacterium P01_A01_bin.40]
MFFKLFQVAIALSFLSSLMGCSVFNRNPPEPSISWQLPEDSDTVDISPDGQLLAVSVGKRESREIRGYSYGGRTSLELRKTSDGSLIKKIPAFSVSSVAISHNNSLIATGTYPGDIHVWNLQTGKLLHSITVPKKDLQLCINTRHDRPCRVSYLDFSPNSKYLASYTNNQGTDIWRVSNGRRLYRFDERKAQFALDGNFFDFADSPLKLYTPENREVVKQLTLEGYPLFSPNEQIIAFYRRNWITLYHQQKQTIQDRLKSPGYFQNWSFSPDSKYFAVASYIPSRGGGDFHVAAHSPSSTEPRTILILYRLSPQGRVIGQKKLLDDENGIRLSSAAIAFSEDNQTFILAGYRGNVRLWNLEDLKF